MGLELPFGIKVLTEDPVDVKYGPYNSVAEANAAIPSSLRQENLQVSIIGEGIYFYKNGISNSDLKPINDSQSAPFVNKGNLSGAFSWDISTEPNITATITGDLSITITNQSNGLVGELYANNDYLGGHKISFTNLVRVSNNGNKEDLDISKSPININKISITMNNDELLAAIEKAYSPAPLSFRSVAVGDWDDVSMWESSIDEVTWTAAIRTPTYTDTVYMESATTATLTRNESVKNISFNGDQDVKRLIGGANELIVWGYIRTYTGVAPGTTESGGSGSGIAGWLDCTLRFKGSEDRNIVELDSFTANSRAAGWDMIFDFDEGVKGTVNRTIRCGNLYVESGILETSDTYEIRIAGDDTGSGDGNGLNEGVCVVSSGAELWTGKIRKNSNDVVGQSLASLTVESGAILRNNESNPRIWAITQDLSGTVQYGYNAENNANLSTIYNNNENSFTPVVDQYSTIEMIAPKAIQLTNDITVNSNFIVNAEPIFDRVDLNGFKLNYGASANLTYKTKGTSSSEFIGTTDPALMPNDLVIDGVLRTLDSNKNIRGNVVILNGGVLNLNGFTLTENFTV